MKKKLLNILTICATMFAVTSCQEKEPFDELTTSKIGITVNMQGFQHGAGKNTQSRAADINTSNLSDFWMTTFVSGRPNYMDAVKYSKGSNGWYTTAGTFFWPKDEELNFYAYSPQSPGNGTVTINQDKQVLEYFTSNYQDDFVYAKSTGNVNANGNTGLNIDFQHALSKVVFSIKNENTAYNVTVNSISVHNIASTGTFSFPSQSGEEAKWTYTSQNSQTSDFTYSADEGSLSMLFIPQQLTKADIASKGACLKIGLKITSTNGTTLYDGDSYVGLSARWEIGKQYNYVLDFSNGAGQDENGNTIKLYTLEGIYDSNCILISPDSYYNNKYYGIDVKRANTFWSNTDVGDANNVITENTEWEAEVIWQDIPSRAINFCDATGKTINGDKYEGKGLKPFYVKVVNNVNSKGNVLVGIKKKGAGTNSYLWSWHLWLTDTPRYIESDNMDRNLGAISATPSDGDMTYGLYYQYGRKDPFVGNINTYDINGTQISVGITINHEATSFSHAVQTPNIYYMPTGMLDWASSNNYTDILWNDINSKKLKGLFDPCPKGWRFGFSGIDEDYASFDSTYKGMLYRKTWFPMAGMIDLNNSHVTGQGIFGKYWTSSGKKVDYGSAFEFLITSKGSFSSTMVPRVEGRPVRCIAGGD